MRYYPELLEKQISGYEAAGLDWRRTAEEKVFPYLENHLPVMRMASEALPHVCGLIYERAIRALALDFPITFVIYVGIGCGAGWATQYGSSPACLLGLEKIAELGWDSEDRLRELLSHEVGHLVHMKWRDELGIFEAHEEDPLFLLLSEGFAKRCEYLIFGAETWNQSDGEDWVHWCGRNKAWLAREYLNRVDERQAMNDFFGDWLDIRGRKQTGYFLALAFIRWLEEKYDTRQIAVLGSEVLQEEARSYLSSLAATLAEDRGARGNG
ncbi:MAG: hypothetical protein ACNA7X_03345 [Dehalococcoidia bacterium]